MVRSSAELRAELADAEAREVEAARVAEQAAAEHEADVEAVRDETRALAKRLRANLDDALAYDRDHPPTPRRHQRQEARAYLRGALVQPGEVAPAESMVATGEPGLEGLYSVALAAGERIAAVTNSLTAEVWLGEGDPAVVELDRIECAAWSAFVARVRVVAAEN
jgi:hypothetical protein